MVYTPPAGGLDMTATEVKGDISAGANRTGLYLAFLQLVFTLGWTTYVIYLPRLAAQVGIAPSAVICVKSRGVSFTLAISPVGIRASSTGV